MFVWLIKLFHLKTQSAQRRSRGETCKVLKTLQVLNLPVVNHSSIVAQPMNGLIIFFVFTKKKKNNKIGFATMMKSELMPVSKKIRN
jgi:hypothetical protein